MQVSSKEYYKILGVQRTASLEVIQGAWRRLAKELHPDLHHDSLEKEEQLKAVNEAYEVLSDDRKRAQYDERSERAAFHERPQTRRAATQKIHVERFGIYSSAFRSAGYDQASHTLELEFKTASVVQYYDVPEYIYTDFLHAASKEEYYRSHLIGQYRERCVK